MNEHILCLNESEIKQDANTNNSSNSYGNNNLEANLDERNYDFRKFKDNFWDEKFHGFEVLWRNLRTTSSSLKEIENFLKETLEIEETYARQTAKATTQLTKNLNNSSISLMWSNVIRDLNQRNSGSHLNFSHRLQELMRELQRYGNELKNKRKKFKENETKMILLIGEFRSAKIQLQKSKEQYYQTSAELVRLKNLLHVNQQLQSNNSSTVAYQNGLQTNIQRCEKRLQSTLEEYKISVTRYNNMRADYIKNFTNSCDSFQSYEETHLNHMIKFFSSYLKHLEDLNQFREKNFKNYLLKLNGFSADSLIEQFISSRCTGHKKPEMVEFVEAPSEIEPIGLKLSNPKRRSMTNPLTMLDPFEISATPSAPPLPPQPPSTASPTTSSSSDINKRKSDGGLLSLFNIDNIINRIKNKEATTLNKSDETIDTSDQLINIFDEPVKSSKSSRSMQLKSKQQGNKNTKKKKERLNSLPSVDTTSKSESNIDDILSLEPPDLLQNTPTSVPNENIANMSGSFDNLDDEAFYREIENSKFKKSRNSEDMNNFYELSQESTLESKLKSEKNTDTDTNFNSDDSDWDSDDSDIPKKILVKIKPIEHANNSPNNDELLNKIGKNLKLNLVTSPSKSVDTKSNMSDSTGSVSTLRNTMNNLQLHLPQPASIPPRPSSASSFTPIQPSENFQKLTKSSVDLNNNIISTSSPTTPTLSTTSTGSTLIETDTNIQKIRPIQLTATSRPVSSITLNPKYSKIQLPVPAIPKRITEQITNQTNNVTIITNTDKETSDVNNDDEIMQF